MFGSACSRRADDCVASRDINTCGTFGKGRFLAALAAFLALVIWSTAAAQAQNVDWLVSVDDTGFDPSPAGGTIEYLVRIDNNGFDGAPATTLDFDVPAGTTLEGTRGDLSNCAPATGVGPLTMTCDVPALAPLQQVIQTVDISTQVSGTTIQVFADVPTAGDILAANNDDDEVTTIIAGADIGLTLTLDGTAASGSLVDFVWEATNNGPNVSNGFSIEFPAPAGIANMQAPAGCALSGGTWTCAIPGVVAAGDSVTRTFTGQAATAASSDITASASVVGQDPSDAVTANNTATGTILITGGTDVSIGKSRAPGGDLLVGDSVTFTLDLAYTGDAPTGLTVTDTVPGNYAITNITAAAGWTCGQAGQTVTCTNPGATVAGANVSLGEIEIEADVVTAGTARNTATVTVAGPADQDLSNNSASDGTATITAPTVDLRANKTGPDPALVVVGNSYSYAISTSNIGSADFFGTITMVDTIPAGLTLDGIGANGWACSPTTGAGPVVVTCTRVYTAADPLGEDETTPRVTLNTTATGAGTLNNALAVSSADANIADTNAANDTIDYAVTSVATGDAADITSAKTMTPDPVVAGEVATFTLEIINLGPQPAADVTLSDTFRNLISTGVGATGSGFVGYTINDNGSGAAGNFSCRTVGSNSTSGRRLICDISTLPVCTAGSTCPTIDVQVRPGDDPGTYTNTLTVESTGTPDPNLGNDNSSVDYTVIARADMTVEKTANPDPVAAGQDLVYVITAQNEDNGLSTAEDVQIVDTLPAGVTFVSATGPSATCTTPAAGSTTGATTNNTVTCDLGDIGNGAQRTVTIVVRPNNAVRGASITNDVTVSTATPEIDLTNNDASATVTVANPDTDILVNKIDDVDPLAIGDIAVYTITVTNSGPSASENVVMTDTMPPALVAYQSHTVSGAGTCSTVPTVGVPGGTLECSWPYLAEGDSETVTVSVIGQAKGTVDNLVSISSDEIVAGFDRLSANNAASQDTTVRNRTNVGIDKSGPAGPVVLGQGFDWTLLVTLPLGSSDADDVTVTDILPADMELTGTPSALVTAGSASATSCTGTAGATDFTCSLGTMAPGSAVEITVPVQITAVAASPQTFTNVASVTTSSFDTDPSDNSDDASIAALGAAASLAGTVFADYVDNGVQDGSDFGLAGIEIALSGTDTGGNPVTATTTTDASGDYLFAALPAGTYTVSRGAVTDPRFALGQTIPGSEGGTAAAGPEINTIVLPINTDGIDYDFAVIPQAAVGLAKDLSGAVSRSADGSFDATFDLVVENFSLEGLINIAVIDPLAGANPLFGSFTALAVPASDPMAPGSYTITGPPSGSCGGLNAGFDGSADETLASGFALPVGGTCTISFSIRVQPEQPRPAGYENQATVTAEGEDSGQTPATNPQLTDLSDDGTEPDADGDNQGNEPGENDPTPLAITPGNPAIALVKTADTSALSSPAQPGEIITYGFAITNTGDVTLSNVTLTDILPGIQITGGPIPSLAPGDTDSATFTATYAITQADINTGSVTNSATTTGTDPDGTDVTDDSGTTITDDTPLVTPLGQGPSIALVKTGDTSAFSAPPAPGDVITYQFAITNTGNVTLSNVTITDTLPGIQISGNPIASLAPGATDATTITATFAIDQADISAGQVDNTATVTGTPPTGPDVTDTDDVTVPITQTPAITLDKVVDTSAVAAGATVGDLLTYSFTITNTGNMPLSDVTVTDALAGVQLVGGPIPLLNPGEVDTATYTASYAITAADIAAGSVVNTATVTGTFGTNPGDVVTDSDSETAPLEVIEAISEVFPPFTTDGGTTTDMLASDLLNNQPATLTNVTLTVLNEDPGVTLDPTTALITLLPGNPAGEYVVEYQICSIATPALCDTTIETVTQAALPGIEATKLQAFTDDGDGIDSVGDLITYTITAENTGNLPLTNVRLVDVITDFDGAGLTLTSGPDFVAADAGSPEGRLEIGETATYTATFVVTQQALDAEGVSNQVTAFGTPEIPAGVPGDPSEISDLSDDGVDSDGNTEDDPTETPLTPPLAPVVTVGGLTLTKSTPLDIVARGDIVPYTITLTNADPFPVGPVNFVDTLPDRFLFVPGSATLNGAAATVTQTGRVITWANVPVPAAGTVTLTLSARVLNGARSGNHVNTVSVFDSTTGALTIGPATATVRILPEAVFDCGDVIGKVFLDHNGNGYQDPPEALRSGAITDQTYYGDKFGKYDVYVPPAPKVESGIPGVRLVAPDGAIITTDANGLYSVPCAALPLDRGSNFILKVDERTLPVGLRITTENPRVVRLTPGMMSEVNFGAAPGQVVSIALNVAAFVVDDAGRLQPGAPLQAGLKAMATQLAGQPVIVRLSWYLDHSAGSTAVAQGRQAMTAVERAIKRHWRWQPGAPVRIVTSIVRGGN